EYAGTFDRWPAIVPRARFASMRCLLVGETAQWAECAPTTPALRAVFDRFPSVTIVAIAEPQSRWMLWAPLAGVSLDAHRPVAGEAAAAAAREAAMHAPASLVVRHNIARSWRHALDLATAGGFDAVTVIGDPTRRRDRRLLERLSIVVR